MGPVRRRGGSGGPPRGGGALGSLRPYVVGGLAGCGGTLVVQPMDMLKTRAQMAQAGRGVARGAGGLVRTGIRVLRAEGVGAFYAGLGAALLRQATYTTVRMGVFRRLSEARSEQAHGGASLPLHEKAAAGVAAGFLGAMAGNPADVALVRVQANAVLPEAERRVYRHAGDALATVAREGGVRGLWRGAGTNAIRAMAVNAAMLATYDEVKQQLAASGVGTEDSLAVQTGAGLAAGAAIVVFSLPLDFVKTRLQAIDPTTGRVPYRGAIDCLAKVLKAEGPLALYSGAGAYYLRCAPHALLVLLFAEQLHRRLP